MPDREFTDGETVAVYGHNVVPDGTLGVVRGKLDPLPGDSEFEYRLEFATAIPGLRESIRVWPMPAELCYDPDEVAAAQRIDAALDADVEAARRVEADGEKARGLRLVREDDATEVARVPRVDSAASQAFVGTPPAGIPELGVALNYVGCAMQMAAQGSAAGADHARQLIEQATSALAEAYKALERAVVS